MQKIICFVLGCFLAVSVAQAQSGKAGTGSLHYVPLNADKYDNATDFSEGLAAVRINNKWGFIDRSGKIVIAPQFNPYQAQFNARFSDGLVAINLVSAQKSGTDGNDPAGTRWGFADKTGKIVIKPRFEGNYYAPPHFVEGLAAVGGSFLGTTIKTFGINTKFGYINKTGALAIAQIYDEAYDFNEGLASVKVGARYGFIDQAGRMVIAPMYDAPGFFKDGIAVVELNNLSYVIDKNNRKVFETGYRGLSGFSEGLARFEADLKVGFIDKKGNVIIRPTLEFGSDQSLRRMYFSEGLCQIEAGTISGSDSGARVSRKFGYINKDGRLVIDARFDYAGPFRDGIAVVSQNGNYGFINKSGKFVIAPIFANVGYFVDGIARVSGGGSFGDYKYRFIKLN